jgi:hypothetical protein
LEAAVSRERRKTFRLEWNMVATLYDVRGGRPRMCIVDNFSNGGAKISGVPPDTVPDELVLRITPHSRPRKSRVIWRSAEAVGVEFTDRRAEQGMGAAAQKQLSYEPA